MEGGLDDAWERSAWCRLDNSLIKASRRSMTDFMATWKPAGSKGIERASWRRFGGHGSANDSSNIKASLLL